MVYWVLDTLKYLDVADDASLSVGNIFLSVSEYFEVSKTQ